MILFKRFLSEASLFLSVISANCGRMLLTLSVLINLAQPASLMAQDTAKSDQWQFMIEPYLWAPGINTTSTNGIDVSIDIPTALSDLKFAIMGVVGVQKGKWSFMIDTFYADLQDTNDSSVNGIRRAIDFQTEVKLKAWIVTPVIGYTLIDYDKSKLDIVAGARYLKPELYVSVNSDRDSAINPEISGYDEYWDGIVGLKGEFSLYEQLFMPLYLDIGTGDSDFTWQVAGGLGYRFGSCDVVAGYRYMSWDFKDSSFLKDLNLSGPYLGVKFVF